MITTIEEVLNKNVDLTSEEYSELNARADKTTEAHGVEGDAPVDEETRHKRIATNYYGSQLNISLNMLGALNNIEQMLAYLIQKIEGAENNGNE